MEVYSFNSSDSSSLSGRSTRKEGKMPKKQRNNPQKPAQKSPPRPWKKKPPVAPLPKTPAKVYKVESDKFREVVQMLTGADPESLPAPQELLEIKPPPPPIITPDILEACRYRVYLRENSLCGYPFPWKLDQEPLAEPDSIGALFPSSSSSPSGWWSSVQLEPRVSVDFGVENTPLNEAHFHFLDA